MYLKFLIRYGTLDYVVSGSLLKLFENYLSNRKQRVTLNGSFSEHSSILCLRARFLVHYYFLFTSTISKEILNQIKRLNRWFGSEASKGFKLS